MLPAAARLTHRDDFTAAVRRGRRIGRKLVVMHVLLADAVPATELPGPRVGFVVSKAVGGSVVRHRVARRLRHLVLERLPRLPAGSRVVVRALPAAASADSAALGRDLDRALRAAVPPGTSAGAGTTGAGAGSAAGGAGSMPPVDAVDRS